MAGGVKCLFRCRVCEGAFTSNLFAAGVKAVNGPLAQTKQPDRDRLKRWVLHLDSGVVCLWCENKADPPQDFVTADTCFNWLNY